MRYEPIPIEKGKSKPPSYKVMTAKEAISQYVDENCYLGMTVSAAPADLIWSLPVKLECPPFLSVLVWLGRLRWVTTGVVSKVRTKCSGGR